MDWFSYDKGLRHEGVKQGREICFRRCVKKLEKSHLCQSVIFITNFKFIHKLILSLLRTLKMSLAVETSPDKSTT